jgi:hypothetical protein
MPDQDTLREEFARQAVMLRRVLGHPDFPPGRRRGTSDQAHRLEQVGRGAADPYGAVPRHHIDRAFDARSKAAAPVDGAELFALQRAAAYEVSVLESTAASPGFPPKERVKVGKQIDALLAAAALPARRTS